MECSYKEEDGDPVKKSNLGRRASLQRHKHKQWKLDDDQISSLDSIGFVWGAQIKIQSIVHMTLDSGTTAILPIEQKLMVIMKHSNQSSYQS